MWSYGFFNSVNGDRTYNAEQMSGIFEGLITNGVYESVGNKLAVQPNNGMTIQIATGRGWFSRRWVNNDSPYTLTLANSDVLLNRYAAICIRVDTTESGREATPYIKYSDFMTAPNKPIMVRTEQIKEYCLAYVYIKAGASEITAEDIEDTRFNRELCGWVTGLITQVDSTTLFNQWEALFNGFLTQSTDNFNTWFNNLTDLIDADVETRLVSALPISLTVTLSASGWLNNTQTVNITGMTPTKSIIVQANGTTVEAYTKASIKCIGQTTNQLTFSCETVPDTDILIDVLHMGV